MLTKNSPDNKCRLELLAEDQSMYIILVLAANDVTD